MKFGVREICNVVFRAKGAMEIGSMKFQPKQPVLYIDTATASSLEQAVTTVYAQGGRGNSRLIAWDGEKEITFSVTDALLSPLGLAILSGAGLFNNGIDGLDKEHEKVHVHTTSTAQVVDGSVDLKANICTDKGSLFVMETNADGSVTGKIFEAKATEDGVLTIDKEANGKVVLIDYYILKESNNVSEIVIDSDVFAGNFYVEADTLFRDQATGKDLPAIITLPNVKIQSNFTFEMAATGDPSTFEFVMDAMPDYTYFDKDKKVICVIQIVDDAEESAVKRHSVMYEDTGIHTEETKSEDDSDVVGH